MILRRFAGSKPKFMITSDISEYMNDETTSTNGNSGGTAVGESASLGNGTYSIGNNLRIIY